MLLGLIYIAIMVLTLITLTAMCKIANYLKDKYGYDPGNIMLLLAAILVMIIMILITYDRCGSFFHCL